MGRKSTKDKKCIYQEMREACGLTRENASELIPAMSEDRIEKLESGKLTATPEDIMAMAEGYKAPSLCNYYCTHECAIGKKYVNETSYEDLSQIVLETLASLNVIRRRQERLIEITADGIIDGDEIDDYILIKQDLERISAAVDSLKLWTEQMLAEGKINQEEYLHKLKEISRQTNNKINKK